jgi:hypothetical protein
MSTDRSEGPVVVIALQILGGILSATAPQPLDGEQKGARPTSPCPLPQIAPAEVAARAAPDAIAEPSAGALPGWLWCETQMQTMGDDAGAPE